MTNNINVINALESLRPGANWTIVGDFVYENITWMDDVQLIPTEEEITAEIARLQTEYDALEYQRLRAADYPSIVDQLDALYHNGYDGWRAIVQQTKDKYPKT